MEKVDIANIDKNNFNTIKNCFSTCKNLKYVDLTNVKDIGPRAFQNINNEVKVYAPSLEGLYKSSFNKQTVESSNFIVPESVKEKYLRKMDFNLELI